MQEKTGLKKEKPVAAARRGERRLRINEKKSVAKTGMILSMGALIATGLMGGRGAKTLHIWSGVALVGFSVWHHRLYHPEIREN